MDKVASIVLWNWNEAIFTGIALARRTTGPRHCLYTFGFTKFGRRVETELPEVSLHLGGFDAMAPNNILYGFPDLSRFVTLCPADANYCRLLSI